MTSKSGLNSYTLLSRSVYHFMCQAPNKAFIEALRGRLILGECNGLDFNSYRDADCEAGHTILGRKPCARASTGLGFG